MGKIKQSTIYILLFAIVFLIAFSINKILAISMLIIALCIFIGKNIYLRQIIKANKLFVKKDYDAALKLYRANIKRKNIFGFIINNYLIMELKFGDSIIAEESANSISLENKNIKPADLLSIKISKALIAWKNNRNDEAILALENLLNEAENTYLYETLTSLLIVNNKLDYALSIVNKGLQYNDSSSVLKSNYAEIQYLLNNVEIAEENFRALVDENVSFMEPYYYLGIILIDKNEKDKGLELLNKSLTFNDSLVSLVNSEKIKNIISSI